MTQSEDLKSAQITQNQNNLERAKEENLLSSKKFQILSGLMGQFLMNNEKDIPKQFEAKSKANLLLTAASVSLSFMLLYSLYNNTK